MKLKVINASLLDRNIKATIHKSGKLGFTMNAAQKLSLSTNKSISIATNEAIQSDKNLYATLSTELSDDGFRINKAGDYYYLSTKELFDHLKIDYEKETIQYDIVDTGELIDGKSIWKFKRRSKTLNRAEFYKSLL